MMIFLLVIVIIIRVSKHTFHSKVFISYNIRALDNVTVEKITGMRRQRLYE
jgi:hypothetical protein